MELKCICIYIDGAFHYENSLSRLKEKHTVLLLPQGVSGKTDINVLLSKRLIGFSMNTLQFNSFWSFVDLQFRDF